MIRRLVITTVSMVIAASCSREAPPPPPTAAQTPAPAAAPTTGPVEVRLTADARARAGIEIGSPVRQAAAERLKLPGTVAPDAYGQTSVAGLAGGQVVSVPAMLGASVKKGDVLATISSADVADVQANYLAHRAAADADHLRIMRLERAVAIGANSQQELDDARAMHASHASELERTSSRLGLLGLSADDLERLFTTKAVSSEYVIRAPTSGVITKRDVNPSQVATADIALFQISRTDRVWIVASAYEQDVARIKVGLPVNVSQRERPDVRRASRVAYVDSQIDPATRTTQLRAELDNPGVTFRFGLLVDVELELPATMGLTVPTDAVQSVGSALVVYLQDPQRPDVFIERPVTAGATDSGQTAIVSGLTDSDRLVIRGAFHVRAERIRTVPLPTATPVVKLGRD
jgi:cobalt-zinc-cadmium efflux system membrane fusion protein